ncbi:hypothetical protein Hanom_Chr07g00676101 [Helianthus anomalus]
MVSLGSCGISLGLGCACDQDSTPFPLRSAFSFPSLNALILVLQSSNFMRKFYKKKFTN